MTSEVTTFATRLAGIISRAHGVGDSRAITELEFNALALELFVLQFANNAAYRRLCDARGMRPASVEHWSRIPAVPAAAFKELELTCLPATERTAVFHSSGTTEQRPSRHFHCAESLALYEALLWPWFRQHVLAGLGDGHWRLAVLTPPSAAAPNSSLVHMFQTVQRKSGASEAIFLGATDATGAWSLDFARVESTIRGAIAANTPLVVAGTAFNFVHLLDWLAERDLRFELPPGSVVMETGGYKGRSREMAKVELHQFIAKRLGVPSSQIICEYGMSELSSQAYDGNAGFGTRNTKHETRNFSFPPWARVQIISPETGREVSDGETGLVRVFDLANAFSVLAVQTEDIAIRRGEAFELLGRAVAAEPRGCSLMAIDSPKS